jgi:hypothetical protein
MFGCDLLRLSGSGLAGTGQRIETTAGTVLASWNVRIFPAALDQPHTFESPQRAIEGAIRSQQSMVRGVRQTLGEFVAVEFGRSRCEQICRRHTNSGFEWQERPWLPAHARNIRRYLVFGQRIYLLIDNSQVSAYKAAMTRRYRRWILPLLASASLHVTLAIALALIASTPPQQLRRSTAQTIAVVVPPDEAPDAQLSDQLLVADAGERDAVFDHTGGPPNPSSPDFDFDKLRARREALFPFLTTDMNFLERASDRVRGAAMALAIPLAVRPNKSPKLPPLRLTQSELQQTIDRGWSRRSRWTAFAEISQLLRTHDPDEGHVPAVLRAYLDQNLLQLFCDTSTRAPRLWAMLENAADHIDFIEFVRVFTRDYPSSVATTELLFLLDKLAQASRDTLLLLVSIDPERELGSAGKDVSEFGAALQRHYRERLEYRQLNSAEDIEAWYEMVRLQILSTVIATSPNGYRAADARFLAGVIHFERGDTAEAIRWWRDIRPDSRDGYVEDYSRLIDELQWPEGVRVRQIKYIIDSVYSRWRTSSLERLRHFGRTCESY